jgi:Kef-type K+ transport system membrane component KefB
MKTLLLIFAMDFHGVAVGRRGGGGGIATAAAAFAPSPPSDAMAAMSTTMSHPPPSCRHRHDRYRHFSGGTNGGRGGGGSIATMQRPPQRRPSPRRIRALGMLPLMPHDILDAIPSNCDVVPSFLGAMGDFLHHSTITASSSIHDGGHLHPLASSFSSSSSSSSLLSDASSSASLPLSNHISLGEIRRDLVEVRREMGTVIGEVESEIAKEMIEEGQKLAYDKSILVTPEMEKASLNNIGHDLIIFLMICSVSAPLSSALNVSPVLLYLAFGLVSGPHGLGLLRGNEEVGFELGDFGILFLLFVEGLNLSPERLRELGSFFSLGATQLLLSVGVIFFGLFLGGPLLFQVVSNPNVPIDPLLVQLLEQPVVAFAIAAAGALSSSAFVLPILKEKGWEDRPDGIAALSILLLQDLAVAPLLVILPLIANVEGGVSSSAAGGGGADPIVLGILAFKATVVFGAVLALASVALRRVFQVVASSRSSQSFVAASLLVAVGMGVVSDFLGLSSTTGAFAAGVLLAESGYRAQIEADIQPFEGILLGVFFITAVSTIYDAQFVDLNFLFPDLRNSNIPYTSYRDLFGSILCHRTTYTIRAQHSIRRP